jgi:hypothetical protein
VGEGRVRGNGSPQTTFTLTPTPSPVKGEGWFSTEHERIPSAGGPERILDFAVRGAPEHVRSDNRPEFIARENPRWLSSASGGTLYIPKAGPWENGYVESLNGRVR